MLVDCGESHERRLLALACVSKKSRLTAACALALAALAASLLAACGRDGARTPVPSPSATPAVTPVAFTPVAARPTPSPRPPPDGLKRGGVLRFAVQEPPPHLDPHQTVSSALVTWGPGIAYSRLFKFATGPDVSTQNGEVECDLCETWSMPDALTLRVTLRADALWQKAAPVAGRAVTAQDVVFSYGRQATPGWPNAPLMSNVANLTAVSGSVIEIKLKYPDAEALENFADAHSLIVAEEAVRQSGDLLRGPVVGSGPWALDSSDADGAAYRANPDYYEPGVPYLDGLDVRVIADAGTRIAAVRNRLLDMDQPLVADAKDAVAVFPALKLSRVLGPGAGAAVWLNASRPPLGSAEVRQAVLKALDPWAAIATVWNGEGVVSPGLPVRDPSWMLPESEMRAYFGSEGAPGQPQGGSLAGASKLEIKVGEFSPRYVQTAETFAEQLTAAGFAVEVVPVTTRDFGEKVWLGGQYQLAVGAPPPVASLNAYLFSTLHSQGARNTHGYSSPSLDALIEKQAVEFDPAARRELVLQVQRDLMGAAVSFNAVTTVSLWVSWDYVRGFAPDLYRGESGWLTHLWLDMPAQ